MQADVLKEISCQQLNVQHKWSVTFGHCLFWIEWLLEEPFCVAEAFSMDWWRPLKLDIWFSYYTVKGARSGKLPEVFCLIVCFLVEQIPFVIIIVAMMVIVMQGIWKLFFWLVYVKCLCQWQLQWSRADWSCSSYCFLFYKLKNSNCPWIVSLYNIYVTIFFIFIVTTISLKIR